MFTRPVRVTLVTCIRHLRRGPTAAFRVPSRTPGAQLQRRCYATPPPQVNHRWVPSTFALINILRELLTHLNSDLSAERYHALSDATMDTLWESLEQLLDAEANPNYEVEYSVRCGSHSHAWTHMLSILPIERGADTQVGRAWDICR